jgi:predicted O-methyltransferase YrrM
MSHFQGTTTPPPPQRNVEVHPLIEDIYRNADDQLRRSAISIAEGQFISNIICNRNVERTLEIGCANGLSSLFICNALSGKSNAHHVIIDPFQSGHWQGRGVANLKAGGFDFFELIEKTSDEALPLLMARGDRFDFVFIDGRHTFDNVLLDFFYAEKLLNVGGVVIFDDANLGAVKQVIRYIFNYPHLTPLGSVPYGAWRRKLLNLTKRGAGIVFRPLTYVLGQTSYEFLADGLIKYWRVNPVDSSSMIAFLKTAEDDRSGEWHESF